MDSPAALWPRPCILLRPGTADAICPAAGIGRVGRRLPNGAQPTAYLPGSTSAAATAEELAAT